MALGRMMRSQHALTYKCNGLAALFVSNSLVILLWAFGVIDGAYFASHINEFLILSNFLGVILTIFVYFKVYIYLTRQSYGQAHCPTRFLVAQDYMICTVVLNTVQGLAGSISSSSTTREWVLLFGP
ncbi:hypothetical protein RF11_15249 [Thelohanellus kitauei]|uniref:Uncharacterized protein n=1 Tax=Thelohanellus kitauei TaxID=669202 RepID=A0A0C2JC92_THEKT|nr:hypothetical protein RF11_15249 [Thelohanellus kitauei]